MKPFPELAEWYTSIEATNLNKVVDIQKAADNGVYNKEYMERIVNDDLQNEIIKHLKNVILLHI